MFNIKKFFKKATTPLKSLTIHDASQLYFCKIAIHTGEGNAAIPHLKLWVPILKSYGYDICIITRTEKAFKDCKSMYNDLNIIYAKGTLDIESIINNLNIKIIFYTSNTGNNLHICRFTEFTHIFLGHGDSNKTGSAHNAFRLYDEVWVAGEAHIDRFRNAGIDMSGIKIRVIGLPQLSLVHKENNPKKSFLYLPTWEGTYKEQSYSSLPIAKKMFCNENIEIDTLAIKLHPMTGSKNKDYKKIAEDLIEDLQSSGIKVQIYPSNINVLDVMPEHSGFICDNSAVITSSLYFNKPMFIYLPQNAKYCRTEIDYNEFAYTFDDEYEFANIYANHTNVGDVCKDAREKAADYFISKKDMKKDKFKHYIDEILCKQLKLVQ